MAQREKLTLDVEVKGARDVDKLADSLEDVESASEQARKALMQMAQTSDSELRSAAQAAEALGRALGPELAGRMDVGQITADLNKMGVGFDTITAEAKEFATTIKQVDDIRLQQVNDGLDNMRTKMDGVRSSSDQSRSVLANLAGNAAQDLGQLGGVVGSLGVGIGQLAEYAVDGNIALSNLAKVAGPMVALTAALGLVNKYMGEAGAEFAAQQERVDAFTGAIEEVGPSATAAATGLQELSDAVKPDQPGILDKLGVAASNLSEDLVNLLTLREGEGAYNVNDLIGDLTDMGYTMNDLSPILAGTEADLDAFLATLREDPASEGRYDRMADQVRNLWDAYHEGEGLAGITDEFFASTLDSANTALQGLNETQGQMSDTWASVIDDMERNGQITDASIGSWQQLRDELQLTDAQMAELVDQKLAEKIEADAAAAEEAAAAFLEFKQAVADTQDVIDKLNVDDIGNIGDALSEALEVGGIAVGLQIEEAEVRAQVDEITDNIQEFVDEHGAVDWSVVLDPAASAAGFDAGLAGMIGNLQTQFQTGIVNAFKSGGAPAAEAFIGEFQPQLAALGMTEAQAREFMGIPPDGNIPLFLQLQINAEAKADALAILNSIQGVDPNNPAIAWLQLQVQTGAIDAVQAEIIALLLAQQYGIEVRPELAQFTPQQIADAERTLTDNPVEIPTEVDPSGAEDGIAEIEDGDYEATIAALADTQEAARQLLDETTRQRQATIYAIAAITSAKAALDSLTDRRIASILAVAFTAGAEYELNYTARRRDSYIYQHVVPVGGGGGGRVGGGPTAGPSMAPAAAGPALMTAPMSAEGELGEATPMLAAAPAAFTAPAAVAPVVNNVFSTVIKTGMIGNQHEMNRLVNRAMRRHARLNGTRN